LSKSTREAPKSQPLVVIVSLAVFAIYFCVLREENEIDEFIFKPLDESIKRPNSVVLKSKINEYEKYGLNTDKLKTVIKDEKK
jgi:hypothetical protein